MTRKPTLEERFWSKVAQGAPDECWEWQAGRGFGGYGQFNWTSREPIPASRAAWRLAFGPIDGKDLCVLHHCDNRLCCNPAHLFLGTRGDNARDAQKKDVPRRDARSGVRGVVWDAERERWSARVTIGGRTHYLGRFSELQVAAKVAADFRAAKLA